MCEEKELTGCLVMHSILHDKICSALVCMSFENSMYLKKIYIYGVKLICHVVDIN